MFRFSDSGRRPLLYSRFLLTAWTLVLRHVSGQLSTELRRDGPGAADDPGGDGKESPAQDPDDGDKNPSRKDKCQSGGGGEPPAGNPDDDDDDDDAGDGDDDGVLMERRARRTRRRKRRTRRRRAKRAGRRRRAARSQRAISF